MTWQALFGQLFQTSEKSEGDICPITRTMYGKNQPSLITTLTHVMIQMKATNQGRSRSQRIITTWQHAVIRIQGFMHFPAPLRSGGLLETAQDF